MNAVFLTNIQSMIDTSGAHYHHLKFQTIVNQLKFFYFSFFVLFEPIFHTYNRPLSIASKTQLPKKSILAEHEVH